jgi:hypothetical protein
MTWLIVAVPVHESDPERHAVISPERFDTKEAAETALPSLLTTLGYGQIRYDAEQGVWEATKPNTGGRYRFWARAP